jgi:wyosine [tRNA(Phe)-imidazoG37] synthetase (radical SAM superfamily)
MEGTLEEPVRVWPGAVPTPWSISGVDLVPFKTCSYDCIYCQLGRTTNKTTDLREFVPVDGLLEDLAGKLRSVPRPEFIGLAGSGEPTLHARMGDIVAGIKALTNIPVAVLTNGSLLWKPEVRAGLADADLVMLSLDAGAQPTFERLNRPLGRGPARWRRCEE